MLLAHIRVQESIWQQAPGAARTHKASVVLVDATVMLSPARQRIRHIGSKEKGVEIKQYPQEQRD